MFRDLKSIADFASEHDFDFVQLSLDFSLLFPENLTESRRGEIRKYYYDKNIGLCFHGPSDIPLVNRHKAIREAGLNRLFEMIDLAVELGGEFFIFHPGRLAFYSSGKNKVLFMEDRIPPKRLIFFRDSLYKILEYAAGRISVCIENTHYMPLSFLDVINEMVRDRGLYLVWDVGYTDVLPADKRARMLKFFNDNIRYVKIVHLHDITDSGGHKALGTGSLNISAYLDIINTIKADVVLEIFPEKSLLESIGYLNSLAANLKIMP
ncbi:MAG: sugar phosphate isomerase/epimerase [Candidatus Zixiibacteriota bacterium]|nr:MAG: sugar phosphate isomerase/epimerase [candidate division Zixibacteria bacterium]